MQETLSPGTGAPTASGSMGRPRRVDDVEPITGEGCSCAYLFFFAVGLAPGWQPDAGQPQEVGRGRRGGGAVRVIGAGGVTERMQLGAPQRGLDGRPGRFVRGFGDEKLDWSGP